VPSNGLFSVTLVRYGQLLAALCTARSQDATAILGGHALAETMLVYAATIVRLKCSFHCFIYLLILLLFTFNHGRKSTFRAAKLHKSFELHKFFSKNYEL
jgi:hypothetical protein